MNNRDGLTSAAGGWNCMRFLSGLLLMSFCAVGSAQAPAHSEAADDEVARSLFEAGKTAYETGNYEDALSFFEQAHARSHRPELLYNIGQSADRMRNDQKALASFKAYLTALPSADNRVEVENRIRALERTRNPYVAPTPRETAHAATPAALSTPATSSDATPLTSKWWFWTGIGGVAVVGVIAAIALSSGDTTQGPIDGRSGVTVMTLAGP